MRRSPSLHRYGVGWRKKLFIFLAAGLLLLVKWFTGSFYWQSRIFAINRWIRWTGVRHICQLFFYFTTVKYSVLCKVLKKAHRQGWTWYCNIDFRVIQQWNLESQSPFFDSYCCSCFYLFQVLLHIFLHSGDILWKHLFPKYLNIHLKVFIQKSHLSLQRVERNKNVNRK